MAGEWIKFECATADKPEVLRAARKLGVDKDLVVGKLMRLWGWFDQNSVDGVVDGVVSTDVDALVKLDGFADVMKSVGWLDFDDDLEQVRLPNFDAHNGETAKKRALKNKRQTKWRQNKDHCVDDAASTCASTREEKRREENINTPPDPPSRGRAKPKFIAKSMPLPDGINANAWVEWCEFRSSKRKPVSEKAAHQQLAMLAKHSLADQAQIVNQSITSDYQGLFPLKGGRSITAVTEQRDGEFISKHTNRDWATGL